jgi:hypothetical protein
MLEPFFLLQSRLIFLQTIFFCYLGAFMEGKVEFLKESGGNRFCFKQNIVCYIGTLWKQKKDLEN